MQILLIYDKGQRDVEKLIQKYGEPLTHNTSEGEVMWKTEEGESLISGVLLEHELGTVVFTLVTCGDDEDVSMFVS